MTKQYEVPVIIKDTMYSHEAYRVYIGTKSTDKKEIKIDYDTHEFFRSIEDMENYVKGLERGLDYGK